MRFTPDWYDKIRRRLSDRRNRLPFLGQTLRILFAPFQRLPDDFALIRASEMPQESLTCILVNECGKASVFRAVPGVQLDHMMTVINAPLK